MKIAITDCSWNSIDVEKKYLPKDAQVDGYQLTTEDEIIEKCSDVAAILSEYAPITRKVMQALKNLKIVSNTAIGYNNIDVEAAKELGIKVANVPGYCAYEVADHAMALILATLRNVVVYERLVRKQIWDITKAPIVRRLAGQTLGLAGFGNIPQFVAKRAKGFEFEILAYDPYVPQSKADQFGVKMVSIEELLEKSDIISCHMPLLPATKDFFNAEKFAMMKKKPVFVNTSRGGLVNEDDLCAALKSGQVGYAALDVMAKEPPVFSDEIFKLENVILTPHSAFYSEESLEEVRRRSAQNVTGFFSGDTSHINFIV